MIDSIAHMAHTTIALIFACVLGVSGLTNGAQFNNGTMMVIPTIPMGLALGGIVFHTHANHRLYGPRAIAHESGHLKQEQLLGALYLPIVGIPSLISAALDNPNHRDLWFEQWADELGGVGGIR